jgi:DNA-binding transcriptional ArsR family regulator
MKTGPTQELVLQQNEIKKAALLLKVVNHPLRFQILQFIHQNKTVSVTTIHRKFKIVQSVASDHLGILRDARLVITERDGRFIYYAINYVEIQRWNSLFTSLK